jgi:hypothetical protein
MEHGLADLQEMRRTGKALEEISVMLSLMEKHTGKQPVSTQT